MKSHRDSVGSITIAFQQLGTYLQGEVTERTLLNQQEHLNLRSLSLRKQIAIANDALLSLRLRHESIEPIFLQQVEMKELCQNIRDLRTRKENIIRKLAAYRASIWDERQETNQLMKDISQKKQVLMRCHQTYTKLKNKMQGKATNSLPHPLICWKTKSKNSPDKCRRFKDSSKYKSEQTKTDMIYKALAAFNQLQQDLRRLNPICQSLTRSSSYRQVLWKVKSCCNRVFKETQIRKYKKPRETYDNSQCSTSRQTSKNQRLPPLWNQKSGLQLFRLINQQQDLKRMFNQKIWGHLRRMMRSQVSERKHTIKEPQSRTSPRVR